MSKYEKIVHIPSLVVSPETSDTIDGLLDDLAEDKITAVLVDYARNDYQHPTASKVLSGTIPAGMTEQQYITFVCGNQSYRSLIRLGHGARYTFFSTHGNTQLIGEDFSSEDIPTDVDAIIAEANGASERLISLNVKAKTQPVEIGDPNLNRVLIQSNFNDRAWVNDVYERLSGMVDKERNLVRNLAYRYMPVFVWTAFLALVWLEYRLANHLWAFHWREPLNGLQLLIVFFALAVDLLVAGLFFVRVLPYVFPYFELEGNLSRRRIAWRWPVSVALTALYGTAVVTLVGALFW